MGPKDFSHSGVLPFPRSGPVLEQGQQLSHSKEPVLLVPSSKALEEKPALSKSTNRPKSFI